MVESRITHVRKRSGKYVLFDENKIVSAVTKAMEAVEDRNDKEVERIKEYVVKKLNADFTDRRPTVEDVQDRVEQALMELQHMKVAKAYILYRHERQQLREQKSQLIGGKVDDIDINLNGLRIMEQRYLLRDEEGKISETPSQLFWRVASKIAMAEHNYGGDPKPAARAFYSMMSRLEFLPSSPILMNVGTNRQLSGCVVLPVEDSLDGIFQALSNAVSMQKRGAGTGFSFSRLRPKNDTVAGTAGVTTGPLHFMRIYEMSLRTIKQAGKRNGANMAIMRVDHPDILDFINAKLDGQSLSNFNISVAITDAFMKAVEEDVEYELINPRTGNPGGKLAARVVFDTIVSSSWRVGDPGVLFLDRINKDNPCRHLGTIEATSPCGEQPMLPYQSCNEGSINLVACVKTKTIEGKIIRELDWERLRKITREAVRFLDDSIDVNNYPLPQVEKMAKQTRKIGLGLMGFADLLYELHIPYASEEAIALGSRIAKTVYEEAEKQSLQLGADRGVFKAFKGSEHEKSGKRLRNSSLMGIAPTGTISLIANTSAGMEPNYALSYTRTIAEGREMLFTNPSFEHVMEDYNLDEDVVKHIAQRGIIIATDDVPEEVRRVLTTSQQIGPEWHIRMQAAFQQHIDGAISKTINFPASASIKEIGDGLTLAWKSGCKGITVYRDGSLPAQVLNMGGSR
jgi:ribonucleoside-diphosphate reductase alpha chain